MEVSALKAIDDLEHIDLQVRADGLAEHGEYITCALATRGFCSIGGAIDDGLLDQMRRDVDEMRSAGRFYQPPDAIVRGLLGEEGSSRIALLSKNVDAGYVADDGDGLRQADNIFGNLCSLLQDYSDFLSFEAPHYTVGVVHEDGLPSDPATSLTEKDVDTWLNIFLRQKIMAILFLGPVEGVLRMKVYSDDNADVQEVRTRPGMLVLLRSDHFSLEHLALGQAFAVSSFFLQGGHTKRHPTHGWNVTQSARELDQWAMERLAVLKEQVQDDTDWDPNIPREWQRAMNLHYFKGHMTAVCGLASKFPSSWDTDSWFRSQAAAPDVIVQVPHMRWDHDDAYDPSLEGWRWGKTFCKHGGFVDGVDLFDNKMFGLSISEAKGMDPNQRHLLEVSYEALYHMGMEKRSLMNANGSIYAGNQAFEIAFVEIPQECRGCGPTGGAGCIAANRISYLFGLKGPSMAVDTDTASSMSALYLTVESTQQKGRSKSADWGVALGCATMLTPLWWHQHCAVGLMTNKGRCLTFDAAANGYVRAEATVGACVRPYADLVDGEVVIDDKIQVLGMIAGCAVNCNSCGAGMTVPNGEAEQQVIADTVRNSGISALDVDFVETHGYGGSLADVVEVSSLMRVHRRENGNPLVITSSKNSFGHMMESCGITSLLKVLLAARYGRVSPGVHLHQVNPHMDDADLPMDLPTEGVDLWRGTNYSGVLSKGFNGTNGYCLTWGKLDSEKVACSDDAAVRAGRLYFASEIEFPQDLDENIYSDEEDEEAIFLMDNVHDEE